jgi:hypothetical protein
MILAAAPTTAALADVFASLLMELLAFGWDRCQATKAKK